jgi:outer membrane lipoprotein-sorting protein
MKYLLIMSLICLSACGGVIPRPTDFSDDSARLLASVERRGLAVKSISGELKTEVWQGSKRVKAKQLIAADPQGRLRIEVLSPFGSPVMTLVSDGSRLMIYAAEEQRFFIGPSTPENMARLIPIKLGPEELAGVLRGAMPLIPHGSAKVDWNTKSGRYRLHLVGDERQQTVEFEPKHFRVTSIRTYVGKTLIYKATFGDYSGTTDAIIPRRILFEIPDDDLRVDMTIIDHRLNPVLPDAAFHLTPPRGIPVESL